MNFQQTTSIIIAICGLISIFGLRYLKHKENMYLIRKDQFLKKDSNVSTYFSTGLILISISLGIVSAVILTRIIDQEIMPVPLAYILCISFFCGIALIISYYYFRKLK